jgi:hypothetical protein
MPTMWLTHLNRLQNSRKPKEWSMDLRRLKEYTTPGQTDRMKLYNA